MMINIEENYLNKALNSIIKKNKKSLDFRNPNDSVDKTS